MKAENRINPSATAPEQTIANSKSWRCTPHCGIWLLAWTLFWVDSPIVSGATLSWDGGSGVNNRWSSAANWSPNAVPQNGDYLIIPVELGVHRSDNDLTGLSLAGLRIDTPAEITGNGITLTDDLEVKDGPVTFSPAITAGADLYIIRVPFGGTLNLRSDLNLNGHTVRFNPGVAEIVYSGRISGNGSLILGNLTEGHIRLTGNLANTYTGETTIFGRTTLERTTGPVLLNGPVTVIGGPLELLTANQLQDNQSLELGGTTVLKLNSFSLLVSALRMNNATIESTTGVLTLNGDLSGYGTLNCNLSLPSGGHVFTVDTGKTLRTTGNVTGFGSLTKAGNGTLSLDGGAHTYGGVTTVNGGQLIFINCEPGADAFGTVVNSTGQLVLQNTVVSSESLTLNATHNPTNVAALISLGVSEWNGPIKLDRSAALEGGGELRLAANISGQGELHLRGNLVRFGGATGTNTFTGKVGVHAANVVLQALTPSRVNFPGAVEVFAGGTLRLGGDAQLMHATSLAVAPGGRVDFDGHDDTLSALTLGGELDTDGGLLTLLGDITTPSGSTNAQLNGRVSLPAGTHVATVNGVSSLLVISAEITGAASLRKNGLGELRLGSLNFYSGATWLDAGRTTLASGASFGAIGGGVFLSSELELNNGLVFAEPLTLLTNSSVRLASGTNLWAGLVTNRGTCSLQVSSNATLLFGGAIHGNGAFRASSFHRGTVGFVGGATNEFTGELSFSRGLLILNRTNAPVFGSGGALRLDGDAVARFGAGNQLPDNLAVHLSGASRLDLNGYRDRITDLTLLGGDLTTGTGLLELAGDITYPSSNGSEPSTISGRIVLTNGTPTIQVGNNGVIQIDAAISGAENIFKSGSGYLILSGSNSFSGWLNVSSGLLVASHPNALGTTTGETKVGSAAVLELWGGHNFGAEPIEMNSSGNGEFPGLVSGGGTNRLDGNIALLRDLGVKVFPGQGLRLHGVISGNAGLEKVDAGTLILAGPQENSYTGDTVVNGGTARLAKDVANGAIRGDLIIGDGSAAANVVVSGVEQIADAADVTIQANATLDLSATSGGERFSRLQGGGRIVLGNRDLRVMQGALASTFSGELSGTGGLIKEGNTRLRLTGLSTFTGPTEINGGTLQVNGSLASSPLRVNSGGTLSGYGTVGPVTAFNGGVVAPGGSPGRLTVTGDFTLRNGSTLVMELDGATAGSQHDQIVAQAGVFLTNVALRVALNFAPTNGQRFRLIDKTSSGAMAGQFNGMPEGATLPINGTVFAGSYVAGTGNDFTLLVNSTSTTNPPALVPPRFTAITKLSNGNIKLDGTGQTNQPIVIEYSDNTEDWNDLGARPLNDGTFSIQDPDPTSPRFYRARLQ